MSVRNRCVLLAVAGMCISPALARGQNNLPPAMNPWGSSPHQVMAPTGAALNQQIANSIAEQLRQSGLLRHYNVDIVFMNGVAELIGQVADQAQHDEIMRIVKGVQGVGRVHDRLELANGREIRPVQGVAPPPEIQPEMGPQPIREPKLKREPAAEYQEPVPIFQAYPGSMPQGGGFTPMPNPAMLPNPATDPPRMPPYAWPTYAPYNNYSRVASPTLYPYNAWPFIGPFYPFPKIPPGWRSVELKWNDGYWWYGRHATGHDWWRVRYR